MAAASALCRATDARLFKWVAKPARSISGTPIAITLRRLNSWNAAMLPVDCVIEAPIGAPNRFASRKWPTSVALKT